MYSFIWRRLPGGWPGKLLGSLLLFAAVVALLFFVVFPWVAPRLPFNHVTINGTPGDNGTPSGRPAATASP